MMSPPERDRRRIADPTWVGQAQGAVNVVGGLWPLLGLRSFEAVFGPKADRWLVFTVAGMLITTGANQVLASRRGDVVTRPRPRRRDSRDPGQHRPRLRPAGQDPLDLPARCRCRGDLDPALAPCRDLTTSDPSPGRGPTAISSQLIAGLSCGDVLQAELVSGIAVGASRG